MVIFWWCSQLLFVIFLCTHCQLRKLLLQLSGENSLLDDLAGWWSFRIIDGPSLPGGDKSLIRVHCHHHHHHYHHDDHHCYYHHWMYHHHCQSLWHLWSEVCEYYVFISTLAFVLYVKSWLWFLLKGKWYLFQVVFFLVTYVVPMVGLSVTYSHLGSVLWAAQQTRSSQYHNWSLFQKESTIIIHWRLYWE